MPNFPKTIKEMDKSELAAKFDNYLENTTKNIKNFNQPIKEIPLKVVLRGKQVDVFVDIRNFIASGERAGYVTLPTGTGKTVIFTEVIKAADKLPTIIIVPTNVLIKQTKDKIREADPTLEVGVVNSYEKDYDKNIILTTYESLVRGIERGIIKPDEFNGMIIADEAHLALTTRRMGAISSFSKAIKIGFTATPDYSDLKKLSNLLPKVIHKMSIEEASKNGLLADFTNILVEASVVDLSSVRVMRNVGRPSDFNEKDLEKILNVPTLTNAAIKIYKTGFGGDKAIVYCSTIKHAEDVAESFREAGIKALSVSSNLAKGEQESIISMFKTGMIDVICNPLLLTIGFDDPLIKVGLNIRPTLSTVLETQRSGRVLRIDESEPYKMKYVIDFVYKDSRAYNATLT